MTDRSADEKLGAAPWLTAPGLQALFSAIEKGGDEARVVGGAIRNTLLEHPVTDVDIATTARPEDVMDRAAAKGLKPIGTGVAHGTVTVVSHGFAYEVTTLREDVETFGRQAKVVFGRDWRQDACRRDFTMNALYCDRHGKLFDPLGGLDDCFNGHVRFIGDPDTRIQEDYLRILRFFRIHAAYGHGELDAAGLGACLRQRDGLRHLSAERIGHEMKRLVAAPLAAECLAQLENTGLWEIATGGLARTADFAALRALDDVAPETRHPELGFTVLAGFVKEDLERISDRFRLSNAERKRMRTALEATRSIRTNGMAPSAAELLFAFGREGAIDGLLVAWAVKAAQTGAEEAGRIFRSVLGDLRLMAVPTFPLKGADLVSLGFEPGKRIGTILMQLENEWRASAFSLSREELLGRIR